MKSGDIRSFFMGTANKSTSKPPPSSGGSNFQSSQEPEPKKNHKETPKKSDDGKDSKKRKSEFIDEDVPKTADHLKRLKKNSEFDDVKDDFQKINIKAGRDTVPKKSPERQKPTYTDNDLDKFKFGDNKFKRKVEDAQFKRATTHADPSANILSNRNRGKASRSNSPKNNKNNVVRSKTTKGMEIEAEDGDTDATEVLSDNDSFDKYQKETKKAPPVQDNKPKSLKDIQSKYKATKPVSPRGDFIDDFDDDLLDTKKGKGKGRSVTPNKGTSEPKSKSAPKRNIKEETIQGIFSGQTIVMTGVMSGISRDDLTNLLKMLGAKVTGSVSSKTNMLIVGHILEDGRAPETGKKYQTAKEKGTKILTETELDDLLEQKTGSRMADGLGAFADGGLGGGSKASKGGAGAGTSGAGTKPKPAGSTSLPPPQKKKPGEKSSELWTDKYAPRDVSEIVGNQNFVKDIMTWLQDWEVVVLYGQKKELKFRPGANRDNFGQANVNARACLISGAPGIGKTTTARLIAKKMGYDIIEQNASDVRNKKAVERLLDDLVNNTLVTYRANTQNKKFIVLMDEVDGMSAGDRGGNQALINAIKKTKTPIICICNDRQNTKVRSLANHCYDIKFSKPNKGQVAKRLAEIAINEGMKVDLNSLEYLCENFNNDLRQLLNYLQMYSRRSNTLTYSNALSDLKKTNKDEAVMMNNFDAAKKLMSTRNLSIRDKLDLFFIDYDLIPLLVQENYLPGNPAASVDELRKLAEATDHVATGDILNRKIRANGDWGLMPQFGFMSSILPTDMLNTFVTFPKFPEWLGKNSSSRKKQRELKELRSMLAGSTSGNRQSILLDYAPAFIRLINYNLKNETSHDVDTVVEILDHYGLELDAIKEHLPDLQLSNSGMKDPLGGVGTQTKSLLTRTFNSRHKTSIKAKKAKRVIGAGEEGAGAGHRFNPEADEEEDQEQDLADELEGDENEDGDDSEVQVEGVKKVKGKGTKAPSGGKGGASKGSKDTGDKKKGPK